MRQLETTVTAIHKGGQRTSLNNMCGFLLREISGTGISTTNRLTQRTPAQRGVTDIGYVVPEPRVMNMVWEARGGGNADMYALRSEILGVFQPQLTGGFVTLVFTIPYGRRYAIDVYLEGELDFPSNSRPDGRTQRFAATLVAGDPRFYDLANGTVTYPPLSTVADDWLVPWTIPWFVARTSGSAVGTYSLDYMTTEDNGAPEHPQIQILGPVVNAGVFNVTTGQLIRLGTSIPAGSLVTIDLKKGYYGSDTPTVRNEFGISFEQFLTNDSDLTFRLSPKGEYLRHSGTYSTGVNNITILGESLSDQTTYTLRWNKRYIGF